MGGFLLVNPRAGAARPTPAEVAEAAAARGIDVHVLRERDDAVAIARDARVDALGVAGGDGSLAPIAAVALARDLPFVCVPLGTRNHFARDLGLDRDDPLGALDAFSGRERTIDVGFAGERPFLNNVSIGLYARLVHGREHHRRRRDTLALARAALLVLRERHAPVLSVDGKPIEAPVVLVANNAYRLELLSIGERERLDGGLLHLYAPTGLARREWRERSGERFVVGADRPVLEAAVDGEPEELATPIALRIEPRALRVLVPPGR